MFTQLQDTPEVRKIIKKLMGGSQSDMNKFALTLETMTQDALVKIKNEGGKAKNIIKIELTVTYPTTN